MNLVLPQKIIPTYNVYRTWFKIWNFEPGSVLAFLWEIRHHA